MAASFMLFVALALLANWAIAAWIHKAFLVIAVSALIFWEVSPLRLPSPAVRFANTTLPPGWTALVEILTFPTKATHSQRGVAVRATLFVHSPTPILDWLAHLWELHLGYDGEL